MNRKKENQTVGWKNNKILAISIRSLINNFCICFTVLLFFTYELVAQQRETDSLLHTLNNQINDSLKTDIWNKLASNYQNTHLDSSVFYTQKALQLSEKTGYLKGEVNALYRLMRIHIMNGDLMSVRKMYRETYDKAEQLGDLVLLGDIVDNMGIAHKDGGLLDSAAFYLGQAYDLRITEKDSTGIAISLNGLGNVANLRSNHEEALEYFRNAHSLSKRINFEGGILSSLNGLGTTYQRLDNTTDALKCYHQLLDIATSNHDLYSKGVVLSNISKVFFIKGDYQNAVDYILKALRINEEIKNRHAITRNLLGASNIYFEMKNYDLAESFTLKGLESAKLAKDLQAQALSNMALGSIYLTNDQKEKALYRLKQAKALSDSLGFKSMSNGADMLAGSVYLKQEKYEASAEVFSRSASKFHLLGEQRNEAKALSNLALSYYHLNQFDSAISTSKRSLDIIIPLGVKNTIRDTYNTLAKANLALGDTAIAYEYILLYNHYKDSLLNEENMKTINELQVKYETSKKEQEIANLNQQATIQQLQIAQKDQAFTRLLLSGLSVILTLGLMLMVILFINYRKRVKSRQERVALEQKLLRTQMNPHFLFNSLMSIQKFIYQQKPEEGSAYIAKFARLVRLILENSRDEFITLEREVETLNLYLELQQVRHAGHFEYEVEVDPSLVPSEDQIPPMFAQPFIENAIKHGFANKQEPGKIAIKFRNKDNQIMFEITDNGRGLGKPDEDEKDHRSLATTITKERLSNFYHGDLKKSQLIIEDQVDQNADIIGTHVSFLLPTPLQSA